MAVACLPPPFLVALGLAVQPWERYHGYDAIILGVAVTELLACAVVARSWPLSVLAAAFGAGALLAGCDARGWPAWSLALTYEVIGSALLVGTARWRSYQGLTGDRPWAPLAVLALPLGMFMVAFAVALDGLDQRSGLLRVYDTPEYRTLTVLVATVALQCFYEAARLRLPVVSVPGSIVAGVALAMAWPSFDWPAWTIALTYEAIAVALLFDTQRWRNYRPETNAEGDRLLAAIIPLAVSVGGASIVALLAVGGWSMTPASTTGRSTAP